MKENGEVKGTKRKKKLRSVTWWLSLLDNHYSLILANDDWIANVSSLLKWEFKKTNEDILYGLDEFKIMK